MPKRGFALRTDSILLVLNQTVLLKIISNDLIEKLVERKLFWKLDAVMKDVGALTVIFKIAEVAATKKDKKQRSKKPGQVEKDFVIELCTASA